MYIYNSHFFRFLYLRNYSPEVCQVWNSSLKEYVLNVQIPDESDIARAYKYDGNTADKTSTVITGKCF